MPPAPSQEILDPSCQLLLEVLPNLPKQRRGEYSHITEPEDFIQLLFLSVKRRPRIWKKRSSAQSPFLVIIGRATSFDQNAHSDYLDPLFCSKPSSNLPRQSFQDEVQLHPAPTSQQLTFFPDSSKTNPNFCLAPNPQQLRQSPFLIQIQNLGLTSFPMILRNLQNGTRIAVPFFPPRVPTSQQRAHSANACGKPRCCPSNTHKEISTSNRQVEQRTSSC